MKISNGTPKATALLEKLKNSGDSVDVYSDEFFNRQPTFQEAQGDAPFYKDGMSEVEYVESGQDECCNSAPKNHLLFIHINPYKKDVHEELCEIFPPLKKQFRTGKHIPSFLILNLYTKQMLCVGLGRKNRLYVIDAEKDTPINAFDLSNGNPRYMDSFISNDYYEAVSDLLHALDELGCAFRKYDDLQTNENEELINQASKMIQVFFPQIDIDELNRGDYL